MPALGKIGKRQRVAMLTFVILAIGSAWFWARSWDPFFASPKSHRDDVEVLFSRTWEGYLNEIPQATGPPTVEELPGVQILPYPKGDLINMRRSKTTQVHFPPPLTAVDAGKSDRVELPGGGAVELVGYSLSFPRADDPKTLDDPAKEALEFRKLGSNTVLTHDQLDELGVPEERRSVSKVLRWFPLLRVIVKTEGLEFTRILEWRAFDARTRANVTQAIDWFVDEEAGLAVLDFNLGIWHDTPLILAFEMPSGAPMRMPIDVLEGYQVAPQPHVRFQLLTVTSRRVTGFRQRKEGAYFLSLDEEGAEPGAGLAYRVLPEVWADHMLLNVKHESGQIERLPVMKGPIGVNRLGCTDQEVAGFDLVFLPDKSRVLFHLSGLPEMPNGREVKNLFDVRIPRLLIPDMGETGYEGESNQDLSRIFLNVIECATETGHDLMQVSPMEKLPDGYLPKRFENISPRELLAEYQLYAQDSYVYVHRAEHEIRFHRPEPLRHRVEQWWYLNKPDWWPKK